MRIEVSSGWRLAVSQIWQPNGAVQVATRNNAERALRADITHRSYKPLTDNR